MTKVSVCEGSVKELRGTLMECRSFVGHVLKVRRSIAVKFFAIDPCDDAFFGKKRSL